MLWHMFCLNTRLYRYTSTFCIMVACMYSTVHVHFQFALRKNLYLKNYLKSKGFSGACF